MSKPYEGAYTQNHLRPKSYRFWETFNEFYHLTLDIDEVMRDLSHYAVDSLRYVECSREIERLGEATYALLQEMAGLVGDEPDEKAALLASVAQFVPADGFDAIPEAARVIRQLARKSTHDICDPDFREMVGALLDRLEPGYDLRQQRHDDEDDGPPLVPGL